MSAPHRAVPSWFPDLVQEVVRELQRLTAEKHNQRPALEQELQQVIESTEGFAASLSKRTLPAAVREAVELRWAAAVERQHQIEAELQSLEQQGRCAAQLVQPEQVRQQLGRLADVLAANDPTRGNLELSLHIDRIVCHRDRKVVVRMCKLGIVPDVVDLLAAPVDPAAGDGPASPRPSRARRRAKLRVVDEDGEVDLHAQASFVADSDRFVGLGEQWFWNDEFYIPERTSWAADHAEVVYRRRQESRLSYGKLAAEFGVTRPTIRAAIEHYLAAHPGERDEVCLRPGGKRPPKFDLSLFADEALQLWNDGWSKEKLARKYNCSSPTVDKALAYALAKEGKALPSREELHSGKVKEARRLLDEGHPLEEIAATMKVSDVTARQYLRDSFAAEGRPMPDLRRRKRG